MTAVQAPKISIVVPVYNTGSYLQRCLNSICDQTLRDIEIICINDASEDDSEKILREFATRDDRIISISFWRNRGVSAARNAGIAIARGDYLGFVDSDDTIDENFYETLYGRSQESKAFIVKGARTKLTEDGQILEDPLNDLIKKDKFAFSSQWTTAIYHTNFIRKNGINLPLGVTNSEDVAFLLKAVSLAPFVEIVDSVCYRYLLRPGSASSGVLSLSRVESAIIAYADIAIFINSREVSEKDYDTLFLRCFTMTCYLFNQTSPGERRAAAKACANAGIELYTMCKRVAPLETKLHILHPAWLPLLRAKDVESLTELLLLIGLSPIKYTAATLRSRLRNQT